MKLQKKKMNAKKFHLKWGGAMYFDRKNVIFLAGDKKLFFVT
jgi:hypothetical protein